MLGVRPALMALSLAPLMEVFCVSPEYSFHLFYDHDLFHTCVGIFSGLSVHLFVDVFRSLVQKLSESPFMVECSQKIPLDSVCVNR